MKLGTKLLAAPLLTAIIMLLVGQLDAFLMSGETDKELSSAQVSLEDFKTVASVQQQLASVHAGVYRMVALIGSMDEPKIKSFRADLALQLGSIRQLAGRLANVSNSDEELRASVLEAEKQIEKYAKQADSAIDLSSVDPNTGIAAMQGADASFANLSKTMGQILNRSEEKSKSVILASQQSSRTTNWLLGVLAMVAAAAAVGASWLVQRKLVAELARAGSVAQDVSNGNLRVDVSTDRQDEVGELMKSLGSMVAQLNHSLTTVFDSSESIRLASAEIATGNQDLADRTEQTATNLQRAASSTEHLTGTVRQSAEAARQATQLAATAAEVARRGGNVVSQVVATMEEINISARKISDIIGVIDGIAFQTNILALNAAVEAARAGEQGRGFAVVASEVRSLAGRSAEAAKEIKSLIGISVAKVDSGSRLVADAGKTMTEIVHSVKRVVDMIGEIASASTEQSDGISQVNAAVMELDQMTQQNAALVEQSAAAAESLRDQAQRLAQVVSIFRLSEGSNRAQVSTGSPRALLTAQ